MNLRRVTVSLAGVVVLLGLTPSMAQAKQDAVEELKCDDAPTVVAHPINIGPPSGTATVTIIVRTDQGVRTCEPVEYAFGSYTAEGPTWPTSGHQELVGSDILSTRLPGSYVLSVPMPECFYQLDLWIGTYVPKDITYPDYGTDAELVLAENGGVKCEKPKPEPTPEPNPHPGNNNNNHDNNPKPDNETHLGTAVHEHGKAQRYGGTAMTGTREEVIRWCVIMIVALLITAALSFTAARKRARA